jgi:3-hydroxyacyl-[acyl-carrier-protein] dehydratase
VPNHRWIVHPDQWASEHVVADLAAIRQYNPQRFEMEMLTAIVHEDAERHACVGFKDLTVDDFWVRGHLPGSPILPAVLMCEAAAQAAHYYAVKHGLYVRSGALRRLKDVRCRGTAGPGERLFVAVKILKSRDALLTCRFQCAIRNRLVCEGILSGGWLSSTTSKAPTVDRAVPVAPDRPSEPAEV